MRMREQDRGRADAVILLPAMVTAKPAPDWFRQLPKHLNGKLG